MEYITVEELMKDAKPSTILRDVREERTRESCDPDVWQAKQAKEAKRLAGIASITHMVVGAEGDN
jgi:hypothetical protein